MKKPIKITYDKICAWCDRNFIAKKKHAKTCGADCRVALSNANRYHKSRGNIT